LCPDIPGTAFLVVEAGDPMDPPKHIEIWSSKFEAFGAVLPVISGK
jgi:hypothetical protein